MREDATGPDAGGAPRADARGTGEATATRRRRVLAAMAAGATAPALAGCSGLGDDDPVVEDLEPGDTTGYGGAIRFGDAYAMSVTRVADGSTTLVGRFSGADRYLRQERADGSIESYLVDGVGYVVEDADCTRYPDLDAGVRSVGSVADDSGARDDQPSRLTVTDRDTIDDRAALVLEADRDDASLTYYVDEETRRLRRLETPTTVVAYRSWNDVDPIEAPDGDCREAPEAPTPTG